jgi:DNA modification methylase
MTKSETILASQSCCDILRKGESVIPTYSGDTELRPSLKEQLRLFAFDETPSTSPDTLTGLDQLSKREKLAALLEGELNFHGQNSRYASHDLHAFAAKFPPQLPRTFIRGLTNPGDVVLDPMMGSGTTVVEALLEGRQAIGLDIDLLALRLCRVKTTPLDLDSLREVGYKVSSRADTLLSDGEFIDRALNEQFDERTKAFIDYWFFPTTQRELMALILAIQEVDNTLIRHFLELTFSSIIITKSGGVSRARDLAHSRPHLDKTKIPKNALEQFLLRLRKNFASIAQLKTNGKSAILEAGDARSMPFADQSIDLIVTSPPYANALDYMRAHKFSLVWFGESVTDLSKLRAIYIGSERIGSNQYDALPDKPEITIRQLAEQDTSKAAILRKYFVEMKMVLAEMHRVLREDSAAIIVVGTSVMRGIDVQTHECLADIAASLGFDVVDVAQRILDRNKRMMPARFGRKTDSMIEQRMHEEYVIGLLKPGCVQGSLHANS